MIRPARLSTLALVAALVLLAHLTWPPAIQPIGPVAAAAATPMLPAVIDDEPDPGPAGRVIAADMPDPSVLRVGDTYFLYATQGVTGNVQTATSTDLLTWTPGPDALPVLGGWAQGGRTWAPEVLSTATGYVLFYSARDRVSGRQCIGRAVAGGPAGPYVDSGATALVCQRDRGGSIDPDPVTAGGRTFLYWKNDGNCCDLPVQLWGQEMDAAAGRLIGTPVALLSPTAAWQGRLIEAPEMFSRAGRHYLFYAANAFDTARYAEGVATCLTLLGPCVDGPGPILTSTTDAIGPGHAFFFEVGDRTVAVFHAWSNDPLRLRAPARWVWIEPVSWVDGSPVINWPRGRDHSAAQLLARRGVVDGSRQLR